MRASAVIAIVSIFCLSATVAQDSPPAETYNVADAYEIYSLLLPHEESYAFAKDTLMIQEKAVSDVDVSNACLTRAVTNKFKDAIAGYNRVHNKRWILQRHFQIGKSYRLVGPDLIKALPDTPPSPSALVFMSAVGFNREKTRAIVYMGSRCGGLCGSASFHLLEKVHGIWKEVPVATCVISW